MNNRSGQSSLTMSHFQFVKCSENFPSSHFLSKKKNTGEWNEFFMAPTFAAHPPRSLSPVALHTVFPSSPTLIPAPLSVKSPRITPWRSNNRTALPSIRIANPATHNPRTWGGRGACMRQSGMTKGKKNLIIKPSAESIPVYSFSVGNGTVSKSRGAVLFLNLKTLKCLYLYASANWRKQ